MAAIAQAHGESWLDTTAGILARTHPRQVALYGIGLPEVCTLCREISNTFQPLGFRTRRDLRQMMTFGLALGGNFLHDPRIADRDILTDTDQPTVRRIARFQIEAANFLDQMWQSPNAQMHYQAALDAILQGEGGSTADFPTPWQTTDAWWQVARKRWQPCRDDGHSFRVVAALMGPLFYTDPVSARLTAIFEGERDLRLRQAALVEEFARRIAVLEG